MRSFFFVVFLRRRHFWCGQWRRPKTGDRGNRTPGLNYAKVALYHWAISPFSLLLISLSWPFQYWWLPFIIHAEMKFTHRPYPKLFEIRRRHSRSPMSPLSPHPFPPLLVFRLINNLANVCAKTTTTKKKKTSTNCWQPTLRLSSSWKGGWTLLRWRCRNRKSTLAMVV